MDYNSFLNSKRIPIEFTGFDPVDLNPGLFDFQRDIVTWACRKGKSALFEDCGLGKTIQQLSWADQVHRYTGGNVLILAPLAVSLQTKSEGSKFGINVNVARDQSDVTPGINITNYEMIDRFDVSKFSGVVLDECFPPDTPIDVFNIDSQHEEKYIKDVSVGDNILNAYGVDNVKNIYKRRINRAIQIFFNGRKITCSENHPFFTMYGWKCAQDILSGDYIMATGTAMRMVRGSFPTEICSAKNAEVLQSILLSEMENEYTRTQSESSYKRSSSTNWEKEISMVQSRFPSSFSRNGTNKKLEPYGKSRNKEEIIHDVAEDGAQTFRAWGEWSRSDIVSAINDGCTYRELGNGIGYIVGRTETGFSDMLQSRLREQRSKNSYRSGRVKSQIEKEPGHQKRQNAEFFRVESVEVLELGDSRLDKYREKSGDVYFYDIKAKRHPSFSVNGALVHNSSILKNYSGKIRNSIIQRFKHTKFKLACTATPSPNDLMELGNHAEFLTDITRSEMLAMFFVHDSGDTSKWRLKKHAEREFWEWVCTWAVMLRNPTEIGYNHQNYNLPELIVTDCCVNTDIQVPEKMTLQHRRRVRRDTIETRCGYAAKLANFTPGPVIIWCELNDESDLLHRMIKDSVEIKGTNKPDFKEKSMVDFAAGKIKALVSKPKISGLGMNWQNCCTQIFVGLSDSYEQYYQAVRRCWRFGQINPVNVFVVYSDKEGAVVENIRRKEHDHNIMFESMINAMQPISGKNIRQTSIKKDYNPTVGIQLPVELMRN